jgi:gamma-glutamylcyclotransferase (GGCT)/AIG2-like uncharacterized protein YtfP
MRWARPFVPYDHWFGPPPPPRSLVDRISGLFSSQPKAAPAEEDFVEYVFVYGTLKRGFQWNEKYLASRVGGLFVSGAVTLPPMSLVVGDCGVPYVLGDGQQATDASASAPTPAPAPIPAPAPVPASDAQPVVGELWRVTAACLRNLDDYEGLSKGYYSRQTIQVSLTAIAGGGDKEQAAATQAAFIYVLTDCPAELRARAKLAEYTIELHKSLYHATQHIQIKQKKYYGSASTWGKTQQVFDENTTATST